MAERTIGSRQVFDGRLLTVRVDDVELPSGRRATREIVEHPGAVAMLAWDGERVALVRQWRQAAGDSLLEIPAGTREPGEDPLTTAQRELAEEVGVSAAQWAQGPAFFTAPGFCTEYLTIFLASELAPADGSAEPDEEGLVVEWLPLDDALTGLDEGRIRDAKSVAVILWLARRLQPARG
jgi:ADP-ribose pyrophosphatase